MTWGAFDTQAPALALFGASRLRAAPAYLATIRPDGSPRVHPVSPIIGGGHVFVFMEPTSPKGRDIRERGHYALHSGVPDTFGSEGEFWVVGEGRVLDDPDAREQATTSAEYPPEDRYVLFDLLVGEARCNGYGDVPLPEPVRWTAA